MQLLVFLAFAAVLSIPANGPPWPHLEGPAWAWGTALGQGVIVLLVAGMIRRAVIRRLERDPAWLPGAQRRMATGQIYIRGVLLAGLAVLLYATEWPVIVRRWGWSQTFYGLDELLILAPFFTSVVLLWVSLYPADRAIRQFSLELRLHAAGPARPVWNLRAYVGFMLRHHVLVVAVPMTPIVMASDFVNAHGSAIRRWSGLAWADQAVLVAMAGLVFLFAPVMLRFIWHTRPLPQGELRSRLDSLCARMGMKYRQILIWESDGMVINAAVMGVVRPLRYVLLSDGLIESMDDQKIEAVFGHEAGHVVHRHMQFYMLFAILSMLVVGGVAELVYRSWPDLADNPSVFQDYFQLGAMGLIVLVWLVGFGFVSRRFEWQADVFGAQGVSYPAAECWLPCHYHGTASGAMQPVKSAICASAAVLFSETLQLIAVLNGMPTEARSWRHSSIAYRMQRLREYAVDPNACRRLHRQVMIIKSILVVGAVIGLAIGVWLYWPTKTPIPSTYAPAHVSTTALHP